jgi:hypothetical protein
VHTSCRTLEHASESGVSGAVATCRTGAKSIDTAFDAIVFRLGSTTQSDETVGLKRPAGTKIFDAETKPRKLRSKTVSPCRDGDPPNVSPEIPAERRYLEATRNRMVCGDWVVELVGLKLMTHHPVIEPVSEIRVGNGIFRCRDGGSNSAFFVCRD